MARDEDSCGRHQHTREKAAHQRTAIEGVHDVLHRDGSCEQQHRQEPPRHAHDERVAGYSSGELASKEAPPGGSDPAANYLTILTSFPTDKRSSRRYPPCVSLMNRLTALDDRLLPGRVSIQQRRP